MVSPTAFVFRAVQRDQTFDQFVPIFPHGPFDDVPVAQVNDAPDSGTDTSDDEAQPDEPAVATPDNENSDSDADTDSAAAAAGGDDQPIPIAATAVLTRHLILPQDPDGTLSQLQHILNNWQANTNSPWVSVTYSLVFGVYYKSMADFMAAQPGTAAQVQGYRPRDLYALEVDRDSLIRFNPSPPLTNRERMALNFANRFEERLAHRQLSVIRHERVEIPQVVLDQSRAWFQARFLAAQQTGNWPSFPFCEWQGHMRARIPEWVSMITNPVQMWQDAAMAALLGLDIND